MAIQPSTPFPYRDKPISLDPGKETPIFHSEGVLTKLKDLMPVRHKKFVGKSKIKPLSCFHFSLGLMYYQGSEVIKKNIDKAFHHFSKAAKKGIREADFYLGEIFLHIEDYDFFRYQRALYHFSRVGKGQEHYAKAEYYLGMCQLYEYSHTEPEKALNHFLKSAEQGFLDAIFCAGQIYSKLLSPPEPEIAFTYFSEAAERGHPAAKYELGMLYSKGIGVKKDYEIALTYIRQSAQQGYWGAQYRLGKIYCVGIPGVVRPDLEEAVPYMRQAAEQNHAAALYHLGKWYYEGAMGIEKDVKIAFQYMLRSAEFNPFGPGKRFLRRMRDAGIEEAIPPESAVSKFSRSYKEYNFPVFEKLPEYNPESEYQLGLLHYKGKVRYTRAGVRKRVRDLDKAFYYFSKATKKGIFKARIYLGKIYFDIKDYDSAHRNFLYSDTDPSKPLPIPEDFFSIPPQHYLRPYYLGRVLFEQRELKRARSCFLHAISIKDNPRVRYYLGRTYFDLGDNQNALEQFVKSAKEGFADAAFFAGTMYYQGRGMRKNFEMAFNYFSQTIEKTPSTPDTDLGRVSAANYYLGKMYYYGQGVQKDNDKAMAHLSKAAKQGHRQADFYMGKIYLDARDNDRAIEHFLKAKDAMKEEESQINLYLSNAYFFKGEIERGFSYLNLTQVKK